MKTTSRELRELKEKSFDDVHDIEQHMLSIHAQDLLKVLSDDLIMAVLEDKEKTFISNNIQAAHEALNMIKDKEQANYCASRLLLKAYTVAILNRNVKGNPIMETILKRKDELLQQEDNDIDAKIMEKLEKEKKATK